MAARIIIALGLALLFLMFFGCHKVPITGREQLDLVPESELISMSFSQYDSLIKDSKLSTNQADVDLVRRVGGRIANAADSFMAHNKMQQQLKDYKWEFNLIQADSIVNAFCMPGGKVAVYTGILPYTKDENGMAVVLGHEISHALANHGGERVSQGLIAQLGGVALSAALANKPQQTQQLALAAFGLGAQVGVLLPFSRTQESEADHIGLILMASAGYDPHVAVPFWERMMKAGGGAPPEFLSDHPSDETRIKAIQKEIPEAMKYYHPRQ